MRVRSRRALGLGRLVLTLRNITPAWGSALVVFLTLDVDCQLLECLSMIILRKIPRLVLWWSFRHEAQHLQVQTC